MLSFQMKNERLMTCPDVFNSIIRECAVEISSFLQSCCVFLVLIKEEQTYRKCYYNKCMTFIDYGWIDVGLHYIFYGLFNFIKYIQTISRSAWVTANWL